MDLKNNRIPLLVSLFLLLSQFFISVRQNKIQLSSSPLPGIWCAVLFMLVGIYGITLARFSFIPQTLQAVAKQTKTLLGQSGLQYVDYNT